MRFEAVSQVLGESEPLWSLLRGSKTSGLGCRPCRSSSRFTRQDSGSDVILFSGHIKVDAMRVH